MSARRWLMGLLALAGCALPEPDRTGRIVCATSGPACPNGFVCLVGHCYPSGTDLGAGTDATDTSPPTDLADTSLPRDVTDATPPADAQDVPAIDAVDAPPPTDASPGADAVDAPAPTDARAMDAGEAGADSGPNADVGADLGAVDSADAADAPAEASADASADVVSDLPARDVMPTCDDRVRNGTETDVDCGGSGCPRCNNDRVCARPSDCFSGICATSLRCAARLLLGNSRTGTLSQIDPSTGSIAMLPPNLGPDGPGGFDLDTTTRTFYAARWGSTRDIGRAPEGATSTSAVYDGITSGPTGIAVDHGAGLMFWGEYYRGLVRANLDGSSSPPALAVSGTTLSPAAGVGQVSLDRARRVVYFLSRDNTSSAGRRIWRVNYDMTSPQVVHSLTSADCLAVDAVGERIYFSDDESLPQSLWSAGLNGETPTRLATLPADGPCSGLAVDRGRARLYFGIGSGTAGSVYQIPLAGTTSSPTVVAGQDHVPNMSPLLLIPDE
ncbi:MAG: hypothetical protein U0325_11205 [Polyangiales bacterium]